MPPRRLLYTFVVPCAAKRVRRRSRGYVAVVDTVPANAPDIKLVVLGPRSTPEGWAERNWDVVR